MFCFIFGQIQKFDFFSNGWHIAGGEGLAANTVNKRVYMRGADGKQKYVTVENDLGMGGDYAEVMDRINLVNIDMTLSLIANTIIGHYGVFM